MASKKKFSLPKTVYVYCDSEDGYLSSTTDIQEDGFTDGEVWGEYQLVRKVKPVSSFSLEEV